MKVTEPEPGHYEINCSFCGLPISVTSAEFGMDCTNHCAEKKYQADLKTNPELKALDDILNGLMPARMKK